MDRLAHSDAGRRIEAMLVAGGVEGGVIGLTERAVPLIEGALARHGSDFLALSHGDPCLSNILFDGRIGLFRLIDPRGATVRDAALMHPLYDLAKFSHSVLGGYDFVNNDLFGIEVGPHLKLELQFHRGGPVRLGEGRVPRPGGARRLGPARDPGGGGLALPVDAAAAPRP
jgi:hypothetical protein